MAERAPTERDIVDRHLTRAWNALTPSAQLEEQVLARLTSSSAATMGAVGLGMASRARPPSAWAALQSTGKLGALVGAALVGVGLLAGYLIRDSQEPAPAAITPLGEQREPAPPPAPGALEARGVTAVSNDVPRAALAEPASPRPPPPSAGRPVQSRTPPTHARESTNTDTAANANDELALLRRADRAVRSSDAALALALIAELETRHPRSTLLEERRAIELLAYCTAGATDARARTQRFLREHPSSAYEGRIRDACAGASDRSAPSTR